VAEWASALKLELETARFRIAHNEKVSANRGGRLTQLTTASDNSQSWLKQVQLSGAHADAPAGGQITELPVAAATAEAQSQAKESKDDDLTWIKGLKGKLNQVGLTSFRQIAGFPEADIAGAEEPPAVRGRNGLYQRNDPPEEMTG
jgi:predicted flap endonuclease-1-like 5' DNA nuclease